MFKPSYILHDHPYGMKYSDVFGLLPATRGNVPERTKMTTKIQPSGQRRGRVTEDREKSVGGEIIPDSAHHREKSVGDKTIPASTHPPFHPSPPFHSPAQDQRGGEDYSCFNSPTLPPPPLSPPPPPIPFTCPGPERRGGDSQQADPGTREEEEGGGGG